MLCCQSASAIAQPPSGLSLYQHDGIPVNADSYYVLFLLDDSLLIPINSLTSDASRLRRTPYGWLGQAAVTDLGQLEKYLTGRKAKRMEVHGKPKAEGVRTFVDYSLNRIASLKQCCPAYDGGGLVASIKEERMDTSDIDLVGRCILSDFSATGSDIHATTMATILGGGGNSEASALGVAPAVLVSSASYQDLLPTADAYFEQQGIATQNHSYGIGIESEYGLLAMAYDDHCNGNPNLVHVFSAGNDGALAANNGSYAGLNGFANLTGQFKLSKNTITVGATDSLGMVLPMSSRGPAHDGRIKPELVAFGTGGSSESAALVAGTSILMQQAYLESLNGQLPPSSLIKAILVNTAYDTGPPGIDFKTGFGCLDAERSLRNMLEGRFKTGEISPNEVLEFPLDIPTNTAKLKATLAWNDPAASPGTDKALLNDLDFDIIYHPTDSIWLPWVLSSFPHPDSLMQPARRAKDDLNNIEQVSLERPAAGSYGLRVKAPLGMTGQQVFSLTWQIEPADTFRWVTPLDGSFFPPDEALMLRWEYNLQATEGVISYRFLGEDWQLISDGAQLGDRHLRYWKTPDRVGHAQLRMETSQGSFESGHFLIAPQPRPMVGFDCPDSLLFFWEKITDATSYEVYGMGDRYMELLATTTDTFFIEDAIGKSARLHYAVAPIFNGIPGPRSSSFNYKQQGVGCYLKGFFLSSKQGDKAEFNASVGTVYGLQAAVLERLLGTGYEQVAQLAPIEAVSFGFEGIQLLEGVNYFRLKLVLSNGREVLSDPIAVYHVENDDYLFYPNPAPVGSTVYLLSSADLIASYQLFDMAGRIVRRNELDNQPTAIDTKGLSAGCYALRVIDEQGGQWSERLIVW